MIKEIQIIEAVAKVFGTTSAVIRGKSRKADIVQARDVVVYLFKTRLGLSNEAIGRKLGGRIPSTVTYSIARSNERFAVDCRARRAFPNRFQDVLPLID